jgi:hypothetical protein
METIFPDEWRSAVTRYLAGRHHPVGTADVARNALGRGYHDMDTPSGGNPEGPRLPLPRRPLGTPAGRAVRVGDFLARSARFLSMPALVRVSLLIGGSPLDPPITPGPTS